MTNTIHEPTRITHANSHRPNSHVTRSNNSRDGETGTLQTDARLSDHKATYISLKVDYDTRHAYKRKIWQYKDADTDKLNYLIETFDWKNLLENTNSVEIASDKFTTQYLKLVRECIPEKTITIRPKDKPWFDSVLRKFIRIRNRLRKKALRSNRHNDWHKYKHIRNKVNNMKKHALQSYYDNIDLYINDANKNNNKLYWKLLKDVFHTKPTMDLPPLQYTTHTGESKYIFSDMGKINALNDYFSSIANVDDKETNLPSFYSLCDETLSDIVIQENEIHTSCEQSSRT